MSLDDLTVKFQDCAAAGVRPMNTAERHAAIETMLAIDTVHNMAHALDFIGD